MRRSYAVDMIHGPLLGRLLAYALPLALTGVLQLLFNAADMIVVGQFTDGSQALAAVGSTSALINLIVNLFIGLSIGTNVLVARYLGARQQDDVFETVHTSVMISVIGGLALSVIGWASSRILLTWMGTPQDVIDLSVLYMRIYFIGMPVNMLYNFGSAILRALGDTRRPFYFLSIAGLINIAFNLLFVIVFHWSVAGVALATIISQGISALLVLYCLIHSEGPCQVHLRQLHINGAKLKAMLRIGLPAGLQGIVFSISNVLIQSSVNSFGSTVMAGNTAAANIEGFVYTAMNAVYQTCLTFTSQNLGAGQIQRIRSILCDCLGIVTGVGLVLGLGAYALGGSLLRIYSDIPSVIACGLIRLSYCCAPYFLCGIMEVFCGSMRGLGYSFVPMLVSLSGACAFRVFWIYTIFQAHPTLETLYLSYPISWGLTALVYLVCFIIAYGRLKRKALKMRTCVA